MRMCECIECVPDLPEPPEWWNELHSEAVNSMEPGKWYKHNEISSNSAVVKDLLSLDLLECRRILLDSHTGHEICEYRLNSVGFVAGAVE